MRYSDRVKIIVNKKSGDDGWDDDIIPVTSDWLPCRITGVKQQMNMNVFGKYESSALAIHFKNDVGPIDYVLYNGVKRKPQAIPKARNNTVVIIGSV